MMRLGQIRKEKGISQQKLADFLQVSRSAVAMWERGASEPDIETLSRLSAFFEVSLDYLLARTDKKNYSLLDGLDIPKELLEVSLAFQNGGIESLTQEEIDKIVEIVKIMRGNKN